MPQSLNGTNLAVSIDYFFFPKGMVKEKLNEDQFTVYFFPLKSSTD